MRQLNIQEIEDLLGWVDKFELSRQSKKLNRDFSDAVLCAEILKQLYPKLVDLHNYPPRNSLSLKFDNWVTLNRKVLKKLTIVLSDDEMHQLSMATAGAIECLLYDIMSISNLHISKSKTSIIDDTEDDMKNDIMLVNVQKKIGDEIVNVSQKMIIHSLYENIQNTLSEKNQAILILTKKIEHLENLIKLKTQRIDDLTSQLAKKSRKMYIEQQEIVFPNNTYSTPSVLF